LVVRFGLKPTNLIERINTVNKSSQNELEFLSYFSKITKSIYYKLNNIPYFGLKSLRNFE